MELKCLPQNKGSLFCVLHVVEPISANTEEDAVGPVTCSLSPLSDNSSALGASLILPSKDLTDGSARSRAAYVASLMYHCQSTRHHEREAVTFHDLTIIRVCNGALLEGHPDILGSALGLRVVAGQLTKQPAIVVFVAQKIHSTWMSHARLLPRCLFGSAGLFCNLDIIAFNSGAPIAKLETTGHLADGLRGGADLIGPGSQVASSGVYGTIGVIARCQERGLLGLVTSRHVAVDLEQPLQRLYHPMPPWHGQSVLLGTTDRAVSFATDHSWYGEFCTQNPGGFVRVDGAFVPFSNDFDLSKVTAELKGIGRMGPTLSVELESTITDYIGRRVHKEGRTTGHTVGIIVAMFVEHAERSGSIIFSDFLVLGDKGGSFDAEGDSGSVVMLQDTKDCLPTPIGLVWGGSRNKGPSGFATGAGPESWTYVTGLSRLLDLLKLDLVTSTSCQSGTYNRQDYEHEAFAPSRA